MYPEFSIGQKASIVKKITSSDIEQFAQLSMDMNPVHLDDDYAKTTSFGKRIAHGAYIASFFSAVIAKNLPGPGSIYLSQNTNFKKPVFIDDEITATVEIINIPKPGIFTLKTTCTNQNLELVVEGEAVVMNRTKGFKNDRS